MANIKPYVFVFFQQNFPPELPPIAMYDLLEDVPGHPRGSTLSEETLKNEGLWVEA